MNCFCAFSLIFCAFCCTSVMVKSDSSESKTQDVSAQAATLPKLVVFSFDGFRNDYVNALDTPNLYALANDGVRGHMRSTMVTKTYPNHQSIATGLYQPHHGIINNEFIDPLTNASFNVDEPSTFWWDMNNISVPIYIANQLFEPQIRLSGAMQWPGSIASYTDGTGRNSSERTRVFYLQDYEKNMNWDRRIDMAIDWLTHPQKPANLVFLYFPEPDSTAHEFGPFSKEVNEQVKGLDNAVGYFRKRLAEVQLSHRTNVIFLSDHGMSEIRDTPEQVFHVEVCNKRFPGLKYQMHGVSPVYSITPISAPLAPQSPNATSVAVAVRDALNSCARELFNDNFKVYLQEDIPQQYQYRGNRRILQLFLVAEDAHDVMVGNNGGWKPKGYPVWGNHGYNNSLPSMRPLFVAQGPRFKQKYTHPTVFENVDLYPLMLHLLQIPVGHFKSNGSYERVRDMLTNQLYLDSNDYLRAHLQKAGAESAGPTEAKWFQFFVYAVIGFAALFIIGACFVLTAGFSHSAVTTTPKNSILGGSYRGGRGNEQNVISTLFNRFKRSNGRGSRLRGSHYEYKPHRHLDSSLDTEEEDELYSRKVTIADTQKKPRRGSSNSNLTEIDWDIVGTGLDIDLQSQLQPGMKQPKTYRDEAQAVSFKKKKEYISLLIEPNESASESELYFTASHPQLEGRVHAAKSDDDDDGLQSADNSSRLIDF